jgi:hypothetical protein
MVAASDLVWVTVVAALTLACVVGDRSIGDYLSQRIEGAGVSRIHLDLLGTQDRAFGPCLAAVSRIACHCA